MDILDKLFFEKEKKEQLHWEGSFIDYLNLVKLNPKIAQTAHYRIYSMIKDCGVVDLKGKRKYDLFSKDLYGLDKTIRRLMDEYFHPAARRLDVKKRVLLLMGPVSGGKSTIASLLKEGLEEYTKTDEGAVYGIKGCPMHEEPLHLIPKELRRDFENEYNVKIEGDLCPVCRLRVEEDYQGKIEKVPIERIVFSEKKRVGIGTFFPSDPKSQDITDLTGSIDFSTIGQYGSESDPRAYRFDGELNIANRGIMEFQEILKADEKFLWNILSLTQEGNFKAGRFSMISADEVIVAHTNEIEYRNFMSNKKNESLQSRIITIPVPYNLQVKEEEKIYTKLIGESDLKDIHIAPHTINTVAIFSVLTRLKESKKYDVDLLTKLKIYNCENVEGFSSVDYGNIKKEYEDEGMFGIDPRFIINRISSTLVQKEKKCINALDILISLKEGLEDYSTISKMEKDLYLRYLSIAKQEYDKKTRKDIQSLFSSYFEDAKNNLMNKYIDNIELYINGDANQSNERLLRVIEEEIGISEMAKYSFREEILFKFKEHNKKNGSFKYMNHHLLKEGIEKKLFSDFKDVIRINYADNLTNSTDSETIKEISKKLIKEYGYCSICVDELLKYQSRLLNY